jgi:hypothetical protein
LPGSAGAIRIVAACSTSPPSVASGCSSSSIVSGGDPLYGCPCRTSFSSARPEHGSGADRERALTVLDPVGDAWDTPPSRPPDVAMTASRRPMPGPPRGRRDTRRQSTRPARLRRGARASRRGPRGHGDAAAGSHLLYRGGRGRVELRPERTESDRHAAAGERRRFPADRVSQGDLSRVHRRHVQHAEAAPPRSGSTWESSARSSVPKSATR